MSSLRSLVLIIASVGFVLTGCAGAQSQGEIEDRRQIACKSKPYGDECRFARSLAGDWAPPRMGRNR